MNSLSPHSKGLILATLGALFLTPDGLLVRIAGTNDWSLLFWRGLSIAVFILIFQLFQQTQKVRPLYPVFWKEWLSVFLGGLGTLTFVLSITHTTVANALVILSAMSLFAAFFSMVFLKERIAIHTWIAMIFAIVGIGVVFLEDINTQGMLGNLFALICAILTALNITLIRSDHAIHVPICFGWGSLMLAGLSLMLAPTIVISSGSALSLGTMGLLSALAFVCLGAAAKMIPAPEVTLLMLLETILGPVWVWVILFEAPSDNALIGGVIVIVTLGAHAMVSLKNNRPQT